MKKTPPSIDFQNATHDELDNYGMQLLILDAPELSVVLRGHMLIERVIEALISEKMTSPEKFFGNQRVSFEMKCDLATSLGVIPDAHFGAAKALNNIRNAYAHREDHSLTIGELNSLKIGWSASQNQAYTSACTKGAGEAARIAIIFLHWSFLSLLPQANGTHKKAL